MKHWLVTAEDAAWIVPGRDRLSALERYYRDGDNAAVIRIEEIYEGDLNLFTEVRKI